MSVPGSHQDSVAVAAPTQWVQRRPFGSQPPWGWGQLLRVGNEAMALGQGLSVQPAEGPGIREGQENLERLIHWVQ